MTKRIVFPFILVAAVWIYLIPASAQSGQHAVQFTDNFSSGSLDQWQFPSAEDWAIGTEGRLHFLHMLRSRPPLEPRRPQQFALLKNIHVGSFTLQTRLRRQGHSMMIVFNYVDPLHFYYVHLSTDPGTKVDVHNGIFIVDGGPRRRIAGLEASPVLPDTNWHSVRLVRDVASGSIQLFVDGDRAPRFSVVDRTFTCGQVGLGSFDETGDFAGVHLRSQDAGCTPGLRSQNHP